MGGEVLLNYCSPEELSNFGVDQDTIKRITNDPSKRLCFQDLVKNKGLWRIEDTLTKHMFSPKKLKGYSVSPNGDLVWVGDGNSIQGTRTNQHSPETFVNNHSTPVVRTPSSSSSEAEFQQLGRRGSLLTSSSPTRYPYIDTYASYPGFPGSTFGQSPQAYRMMSSLDQGPLPETPDQPNGRNCGAQQMSLSAPANVDTPVRGPASFQYLQPHQITFDSPDVQSNQTDATVAEADQSLINANLHLEKKLAQLKQELKNDFHQELQDLKTSITGTMDSLRIELKDMITCQKDIIDQVTDMKSNISQIPSMEQSVLDIQEDLSNLTFDVAYVRTTHIMPMDRRLSSLSSNVSNLHDELVKVKTGVSLELQQISLSSSSVKQSCTCCLVSEEVSLIKQEIRAVKTEVRQLRDELHAQKTAAYCQTEIRQAVNDLKVKVDQINQEHLNEESTLDQSMDDNESADTFCDTEMTQEWLLWSNRVTTARPDSPSHDEGEALDKCASPRSQEPCTIQHQPDKITLHETVADLDESGYCLDQRNDGSSRPRDSNQAVHEDLPSQAGNRDSVNDKVCFKSGTPEHLKTECSKTIESIDNTVVFTVDTQEVLNK